MQNQTPIIASRYCDNLEQSVILCRQASDDSTQPPQYRCLSSHLCGKTDCMHDPMELSSTEEG
ncbi:MAG: hypothetical protein J6I50_09255 [Clostridia bacterium]|nr:hypothetical protein [Clostridia bacterium]